MKELAQEALDVQNASNILGITRSFHEAVCDMRRNGLSSEEIETHPITAMWVWKISSMTRWFTPDIDRVAEALNTCGDMAKGEMT